MLIQAGFAMSKIGEAEALQQVGMLKEPGETEMAIEEVQGCGSGGSDGDDAPPAATSAVGP